LTKKGERYGDSILRTKLHRPKVTGDIVRRQRLHEQMDLGLETPLTVVSAPAGYGKSMLVSHWAESLDHPCAWVSLDRTDSELEPFVAYFLAAVESLFPESCRETATLLHAANLPPVPVVARSLANELDVLDTPFVLVLDDYHRLHRRRPSTSSSPSSSSILPILCVWSSRLGTILRWGCRRSVQGTV